jgi:predicted RNA-binding protein YlxR (DUF448 family)
MVRVVVTAGGSLVVGTTSQGRGAWLCRDSPRCFEQAARRNAFDRALRREVAPTEVARLKMTLGEERSAEEQAGPGSGGSGR